MPPAVTRYAAADGVPVRPLTAQDDAQEPVLGPSVVAEQVSRPVVLVTARIRIAILVVVGDGAAASDQLLAQGGTGLQPHLDEPLAAHIP